MSKYVRIYLPHDRGDAEVEVAGTRIEDQINRLSITAGISPTQTVVTVDLIAVPLEFSGDAEVQIGEAQAAVLQALGWTPPAEAQTTFIGPTT